MNTKGIVANDFTYQAIATCCHSKQEATQLLTIIKDKGRCPNEFIWGTLCGVAAKRRNYDYLLHLLKVINSLKLLMAICSLCRKWKTWIAIQTRQQFPYWMQPVPRRYVTYVTLTKFIIHSIEGLPIYWTQEVL